MFEVQYICLQSWVPVRASESSASEMVTSLLFGETCTVIGEKNDWLQIKTNHDGYRKAIVNEPRGSEVMVGAILVPAFDNQNFGGIIFFNNVGYLGMCGHGTIGVVATLSHLGRLKPGTHRFETVAGMV